MWMGPDADAAGRGIGEMTDIATIQAALGRIESEAAQTADAIRRMVPDGCDRDAAILAAYNRTGGIAAEARRAIRDFTRAIRDL